MERARPVVVVPVLGRPHAITWKDGAGADLPEVDLLRTEVAIIIIYSRVEVDFEDCIATI